MPILKKIFNLDEKWILFFFLFILINVCPTAAQQITFSKVAPPEGYHFGIVNGISQDRYGYIWLATFAVGLRRYDGYHFKTYLNDPLDSGSLASNNLEEVYATRNGIIWIGTVDSGLDRLDPATGIFTHFRHKREDLNSISDDRITAILEDHAGVIWVGTENGLNRFDPKSGTFLRYHHKTNDAASLSNNFVDVLYEDRQHTLWIGTGSRHEDSVTSKNAGGFSALDKKRQNFSRYVCNPEESSRFIQNRVTAVFEDRKGQFWVGTADGELYLMDRKSGSFQRYPFNPASPEDLSKFLAKEAQQSTWSRRITFISEDSLGTLWAGSARGWIARYDHETKKLKHYLSLNDDSWDLKNVSHGFISREGVLWIISWLGHIYRSDPYQSTIPHSLTRNPVNAIHQDASGALWIGTGDGLIRTDKNKSIVKRFAADRAGQHSFNDVWISLIYEEDDSTLWFGSNRGLTRYNRKTEKFTRYSHDPHDTTSLSNGSIEAIVPDQPGSLWIATNAGLERFNIKNGVFTHYRNKTNDSNSLSDNGVICLLKDHAGNVWAGTAYAINKLNAQAHIIKRFPFVRGVTSIIEDSDHIIWAGSSNGLYRSNRAVDSFSLFTDPWMTMTAKTIITSILEDDQKNLWVSSPGGIFRISSDRNEISVFNKTQGVDVSDLLFYHTRGGKGRSGELFFGDKTGYYEFLPEKIKTNTTAPQIVFNNFYLANQPVMPGRSSPLKMSINQVKEIRLKHNQNVFSFEFAGLHYSNPEANPHLYMLENLDDTWIKPGPEKRAFYYNVPPGRYIFRVRAANSNGVWAEKSIVIIITPPWWTSWWFLIGAFICVVTLFYVSIRWRLQQKFQRQLEHSEKEKQVAEMRQKTAELQQQTTELEMQALRSQMNPHFIFNSLNSVNMFILENNKSQASEYLSKFSRLVRLILHHSQESFIPLDKELEALQLYLELESLRFEKRFEYKISVRDVDTTMMKVPPLIIQPYAENAIWHGLMQKKEKGHLEIELYLNEEVLFCKITDDGIGRMRAAELKSKSSLTYKSMGMRITADRLAMLQRQEKIDNFIEVNDLVLSDGGPAGTEVIIKVPFHYD